MLGDFAVLCAKSTAGANVTVDVKVRPWSLDANGAQVHGSEQVFSNAMSAGFWQPLGSIDNRTTKYAGADLMFVVTPSASITGTITFSWYPFCLGVTGYTPLPDHGLAIPATIAYAGSSAVMRASAEIGPGYGQTPTLGRLWRLAVRNNCNRAVNFQCEGKSWRFNSTSALLLSSNQSSYDYGTLPSDGAWRVGPTIADAVYIGALHTTYIELGGVATTGEIAIEHQCSTDGGATWPTDSGGFRVATLTLAAQTADMRVPLFLGF